MGAKRRGWTAGQGIARARALLAAACLGLAACAATQASDTAVPDAEADALTRALAASPPELPPGAVVVRLAFGAAADLDLYVTDPLEEAVYFGNTPARSGGRLLADLRCDAPAPRVETIVFDPAPSGRYRVGVDFPERCDGGRGDVAFAVETWVDGRRELRTGRLSPALFEPIVLELVSPTTRSKSAH
jgi:hypothetical protein